jgi:hypothetical protein
MTWNWNDMLAGLVRVCILNTAFNFEEKGNLFLSNYIPFDEVFTGYLSFFHFVSLMVVATLVGYEMSWFSICMNHDLPTHTYLILFFGYLENNGHILPTYLKFCLCLLRIYIWRSY